MLHPEKPSEVIRKLHTAGFEGPLGGGKHIVMRHPQTGKKISVPIHGARGIPMGTLGAILRRAEISVEESQEL
ncbi:MAG: type II toxin-antitoxin system HicA family toxin [Dehalococcoidia bacterium]|nr:MAG: type II toxin-antitoxin system HicA family toxin [Dehalococcoidia bacterium]